LIASLLEPALFYPSLEHASPHLILLLAYKSRDHDLSPTDPRPTFLTTSIKHFSSRHATTMGVIDFIKDILRPGNGVDYPKPGDMVTVHYHGYLYDPTRSWNRGRRYVAFLL
jgi:hypothetical protein